jgi:hypothetical protein
MNAPAAAAAAAGLPTLAPAGRRPAGGFKSDVDTKAMASDPAQFLAVCVLDSFTKLSFSLSYDFCIFSP